MEFSVSPAEEWLLDGVSSDTSTTANPPSTSNPPQEPDQREGISNLLMLGRKKLRELYSQMARIQSHEEFNKTCHLQEQKVPKGLRVKVCYNALLAKKKQKRM